MTWKATVHSAIGTRHEQRGQSCQDYGNFREKGFYLLGAVSDGAGSAKYAEAGAQIAVESALGAIAQILAKQFASPLQDAPILPQDTIDTIAPDLFKQVFAHVLSTLNQEAIDSGCELRDLNCTLLAFAATPQWIAAMQIGDGFMVVRSQTETTYRLLFKPDKGEFINETLFVTTPNVLKDLQINVVAVESPFVCAATDGLERVAIHLQDWLPHAPFFQPFETCLSQIADQSEREAYLKTFLNSERLNAKTDDDKTLLMCAYNGSCLEGI